MQRARTIEEYYVEREAAAPLETRIKLSGVPSDYWKLGWDDYDDTAMCRDETVKSILMDYGATWEPADRQAIVLLGKPGRGKTLGMALLAMELIEKGCWTRWTTWADLVKAKHELVDLEQQARRNDDWEQHERAELKMRWITTDCQALFLDDVGQEYRSASGWADTELSHLVRSRQAAGKLTFVTSNIAKEKWVEYSEAMASFLMELGEVVAVTGGKDYREKPGDKRVARRARR